MIYPFSQNNAAESRSASSFGGINRTERGRSGEWLDALDLDTEHYPCLAPRVSHGPVINVSPADGASSGTLSVKIAACAEPVKDDGEYHGFTGVVLCDSCVKADGGAEKNFCFLYNGEIMKVDVAKLRGQAHPEPVRTAMWEFAGYDDISDETDFYANLERVIWSVAYVGRKYVINGYDPVTERGKFFTYDPYDTDVTWVVAAAEQLKVTGGLKMGSSSQTKYSEYSRINYIISQGGSGYSVVDFSDYFTEGDYLLINIIRNPEDGSESRLKKNEVFPYAKSGAYAKYAVVREIVNKYDSDENLVSSAVYYYSTRPDGKFVTNVQLSDIGITLGTFVPPMSHIASFGSRVWGVNPVEDSVYASVFDTPFKVINTDAQLDAAMSWQAVLGTPDEAQGVFPSGAELIVFKKNSLMRINGASAPSFGITGIFRGCGCIDIRSAAECAGTVFYLGYGGFYAYDGAQPKVISASLGRRYKRAVGICDAYKYYVSAVTDEGTHEFLVYDTRCGTWLQWSGIGECAGAFHSGSGIYAAFNAPHGCVVRLNGSPESHCWSCESVPHYESVNGFKGINELWIRALIGDGAQVRVFTSVNGGEWKEHKTLHGKGRVFIYKIPVRLCAGDYWSYRLEGNSGAVIYNIERVFDNTGKRHYGAY